MNGSPPPGRRMRSRTRMSVLIASVILALLPATAAMAGVLEDQLAKTRDEAASAKADLARVDQQQEQLVAQVSALNARIRELDTPIGRLAQQIDSLETQIVNREARITDLRKEYATQKVEIARLGLELGAARDLLTTRVVEAYKQGDASWLEQMAGSGTLRDMLARQDALGQVVGLDEKVIGRIADTERDVRVKRAANQDVRRRIASDIDGLEADHAELDASKSELEGRRAELAQVKSVRDERLAELKARGEKLGEQVDSLESDADLLKEAIRSGTTDYSGLPGIAPNGLIWPVNGPVVSPFGMRWGRMHEGIDIAVGTGTPIHAAAPGVVTYAGEMSGYGNLVIVQHAGILSTAYAHQSQIASAVGQTVGQGQVIGYVGCTGHCFGPHLHFETRENGSAVDPMNYL